MPSCVRPPVRQGAPISRSALRTGSGSQSPIGRRWARLTQPYSVVRQPPCSWPCSRAPIGRWAMIVEVIRPSGATGAHFSQTIWVATIGSASAIAST